jgi:hypothetical protein
MAMADPPPRDLIVLVADSHMRSALRGLFGRPKRVGIRPIYADIDVHTQRDPGVYRRGHELLRSSQDDYDYAVALFDREGCGAERLGVDALEAEAQSRLDGSGWQGRSAVVAIDPELEAWVWGEPGSVAEALSLRPQQLRDMLAAEALDERGKPAHPKADLERALELGGVRVAARVYEQLGFSVGFSNCHDRSFLRLLGILREWFPPED